MRNGNGSGNRSLKTQMREFARTRNGEIVFAAALAVANEVGTDKDQANSLANKAAIQSLVRPVVVSSYDDLSESTIEMLAEGNYSELIIVTGSTSAATFDPRAIKYNSAALLAVLFPILQPLLDRNPASIAVAAAGLVAGLAALQDQWKQEVTGVDAEVVLILKKIITFETSSTVAKVFLFDEINTARNMRGASALSQGDFDSSLQRLLAYKFIDYDSAQENVTLKS